MKAVMVMFDTLSRRYLSTYGNSWVKTPNFERLKSHSVQFEKFYAGSLPCMPARRELHTGRYNFLHRGWGPLEPFDVSAIDLMKQHGIYTHICTDHSHYWEDGGATYLPRYSSWEGFRGQEGDRWVGMVNAQQRLRIPAQNDSVRKKESFYVNHANRTRMQEEEAFSGVRTMQAGMAFLDLNYEEDHWFLQIECFDPHEPFHVPQRFLDLYEQADTEDIFDWPPYAPACESEEERRQVIVRYAALISMCDAYLGKVLDKFDAYGLWEDTMLIVNTDHGFLMGEHDWWGKNIQPAYQEIVHLPFYLYDPRQPISGQRTALAQTIDLAPTLLEFFEIEHPKSMQGHSLLPVIKEDHPIREAALFGNHGGHVNVTDGHYVYMRSSMTSKNQPLYDYTLMPTAMRGYLNPKSLHKASLTSEFACFQQMPVLKLPAQSFLSSYRFHHRLYDIEKDPQQKVLLDNVELELDMIEKMRQLMQESEAPLEQYERLGIDNNHRMLAEDLLAKRMQQEKQDLIPVSFSLTAAEQQQILMLREMLPEAVHPSIYERLEAAHLQQGVWFIVEELARQSMTQRHLPKEIQTMFLDLLQNAGKVD